MEFDRRNFLILFIFYSIKVSFKIAFPSLENKYIFIARIVRLHTLAGGRRIDRYQSKLKIELESPGLLDRARIYRRRALKMNHDRENRRSFRGRFRSHYRNQAHPLGITPTTDAGRLLGKQDCAAKQLAAVTREIGIASVARVYVHEAGRERWKQLNRLEFFRIYVEMAKKDSRSEWITKR